MPRIYPFKALRPVPDIAELVSAKVNGAISDEDIVDALQSNPFSYLHVVKPYLHFAEPRDPAKHYPLGRNYFSQLIQQGILNQDEKSCFYLYKQVNNDKGFSCFGIIGAANIYDYFEGRIKKHENTITIKEERMVAHVNTIGAVGEPVLLTYDHDDEIDIYLENEQKNEPLYHFTSADNLTHTIWVLDEASKVDKISDMFDKIVNFYIADGHHRIASSSKYLKDKGDTKNLPKESLNFMSMLISDTQLKIYPFYRLISSRGINKDILLHMLSEDFEIVASGQPIFPHEKYHYGLNFEGKWFDLKLRHPITATNPVDDLDVQIVEKLMIQKAFGIADSKTDERISFFEAVRGEKELESLINSGQYNIAITLCEVTKDELYAVSDANLTMPPKSTWIEPKLRTGLLIQKF